MTENTAPQVYGRLTVIGEPFRKVYGTQGKRRSHAKCRCSCGTVKTYLVSLLKSGKTQSCGCLHREQLSERRTTHGHRRGGKESRTYYSWASMITRCTNPNSSGYPDYGGRGIQVCGHWLGKNGFQNFLEDIGERPEGMTIDRKDRDGHYCKENCRWASAEEQANNKRNNRLITAFGSIQTLAQWSKESGIKSHTIRRRIDKLGWSPEDAVMEPLR